MASRAAQMQMQRTKEDVQVMNKVQSAQIVKNGTKAFLSAICWFRGLFGRESFRETNYGELPINLLVCPTVRHRQSKLSSASKSTEISPAEKFLGWIEKGLYDMIENEYLYRMKFTLSKKATADEDNGAEKYTVFETYTMTYDYDDEGCFTLSGGKVSQQIQQGKNQRWNENIQHQTAHILRSINALTQTAGPLPEDTHMAINVEFNDTVPAGYKAPWFTETYAGDVEETKEAMESMSFKPHQKYYKIPTGTVCTPYRTIDLTMNLLEDTIENEDLKKSVADKRRKNEARQSMGGAMHPETPVVRLNILSQSLEASQSQITADAKTSASSKDEPREKVAPAVTHSYNRLWMPCADSQHVLESVLKLLYLSPLRRPVPGAAVSYKKQKSISYATVKSKTKSRSDTLSKVFSHLVKHGFITEKKTRRSSNTYDINHAKFEEAKAFISHNGGLQESVVTKRKEEIGSIGKFDEAVAMTSNLSVVNAAEAETDTEGSVEDLLQSSGSSTYNAKEHVEDLKPAFLSRHTNTQTLSKKRKRGRYSAQVEEHLIHRNKSFTGQSPARKIPRRKTSQTVFSTASQFGQRFASQPMEEFAESFCY